MLPFYVAMLVSLVIITYVPATSLWLPVQTGQVKAEEVDKLEFLKAQTEP